MTLRARLWLWYTGVLCVCAGSISFGMYFLARHKLRSEFRKYLADEFSGFRQATLYDLDDLPQLRAKVRSTVASAKYYPLTYRLYDTDAGRFVVTEENRWPGKLPSVPFFDPGGPSKQFSTAQVGGNRGRCVYVLAGWLDPERSPGMVLEVGVYYYRLDKMLDSLRDRTLAAFALTMLVAGVGGQVLVWRSLRPVDRLARALESIEPDNLSARLPGADGHDEIARVAARANDMLARLEAAFRAVRSFTADAAHELRTPLAALRCRLEVAREGQRSPGAYEEAIADALDQAVRIEALLDELLLLARLDAQAAIPNAEAVKLSPLLRELVELYGPLAEQRRVRLSADLAGPFEADGNPGLLKRLFGNLLENAILYTPSGGSVEVALTPGPKGCRIAVADSGVGIPPEQQGKVFDRFVRLDQARSSGGVGLGLSIAQKTAELHGGRIELTSAVGRGSTFTVILPDARALGEP